MKKVIVIGAGVAGKQLLQEIKKNKKLDLQVVGFIDDDRKKQGKKVLGVKILGRRAEISDEIKKHGVEEVLIALPSVQGRVIREVIDECRSLNVSFKVIPRSIDIVQGKVSISQIRNPQVEDIIGREIVKLELAPIKKLFRNKTIFITGACGSIGHEICRQLTNFSPRKLVFYDWWENGMFDLDLEFREKFPEIKTTPVIGDVKDYKRLEKVFEKERVDFVFHAAAYKHVPLMEYNPSEAVKNNILGTRNLVKVASKYNASHFIFISTDKAVKPKNVMGATKLIAEGLVAIASKRTKTKYISVRFGNVLDSFGSMLPLFRKQITSGGPVTVTHKKMERYFMSIPEAVQLIFQATLLGKGGEIFILDMGDPIKISELANILIKLSGLRPGKDIEIVYTGLRPGEKLSEELFTEKEKLVKTSHKKVLKTKNFGLELKNLDDCVDKLVDNALESNDIMVRKLLKKITPGIE